jgi:hypothetical protein
VLILNSMFGNTFTLYSVAPVGWLLVGWISAATLRQQEFRNAEGVRHLQPRVTPWVNNPSNDSSP